MLGPEPGWGGRGSQEEEADVEMQPGRRTKPWEPTALPLTASGVLVLPNGACSDGPLAHLCLPWTAVEQHQAHPEGLFSAGMMRAMNPDLYGSALSLASQGHPMSSATNPLSLLSPTLHLPTVLIETVSGLRIQPDALSPHQP